MPAALVGLWKEGWALHWLQTDHPSAIDGRSKVPFPGWNKGPRRTLEELTRTWRAGVNASVRLGAASTFEDGTCLAIVDVDVKGGTDGDWKEAWGVVTREFPAALGAPVLWTGRGAHAYVRLKPSQLRVTELVERSPRQVRVRVDGDLVQRAAWEVSLYAEGRHALIVGSIHPDTRSEYTWYRAWKGYLSAPLLDLPTSRMRAADAAEGPSRAAEGPIEIEDVDPADLGLRTDQVDMLVAGVGIGEPGGPPTRSEAAFSLALALLRRGASESVIFGALTNPDFAVGRMPYDHRKTKSRRRAAGYIERYVMQNARRTIAAGDRVLEIEPEADAGEAPPRAAGDDDDDAAPGRKTKKGKKPGKAGGDENDGARRRPVLMPFGFDKVDGWVARLQMKYDESKPWLPPVVLPTFWNVRLMLANLCEKPEFLAIDVFAQRSVYLATTPWGAAAGDELSGDDTDAVRVKTWLSDTYMLQPSLNTIEEALKAVAVAGSFHPLRDYLEELEWDGVERVDQALAYYFGATPPEPYLSTVSRLFFQAAVQRVFEPGTKFDNVVVLEGKTGWGKSAFPKILASGSLDSHRWFIDELPEFSDKDAALNLAGIWICELGEMEVLQRSSHGSAKRFISRAEDKVRPPYGRRRQDYKRSTVFIGTTEEHEYLNDPISNRRWWPVPIGHQLRFDELIRDRNQLWAEAVFNYRFDKRQSWLDGTALEQAEVLQELRRVEDLGDRMVQLFEDYLVANPDTTVVKLGDLFEQGPWIGLAYSDFTAKRGARVLRKFGFEKGAGRIEGQLSKVWRRVILA